MSLGPGDTGWEAHTLFDQYGGKYSTRSKAVGHSPTRTSRLRSHILKLSCYLNGEADRGRASIVRLPMECDTLGEVIPKIHKRLDLDKKIMYAAELFLPDGTKITDYQMLEDAAENDHAIIVGCGEAFDPTTVPYDLLESYLHGGGRNALKNVKKQLNHKQKVAAHEKADTIRAQGHGVYPNSVAVVTARSEAVEQNREIAAQMRHEYMEQLMFRADQQKTLTDAVQRNSAIHKMERAASKERRKDFERERMENLQIEKAEYKRYAEEKKAALFARLDRNHDAVKQAYQERHKAKAPKTLLTFASSQLTTSLAGRGEDWGDVRTDDGERAAQGLGAPMSVLDGGMETVDEYVGRAGFADDSVLDTKTAFGKNDQLGNVS